MLIDALATVIKQRRAKLGLSQDELAERAGMHRTYLSDLERATRNPSIKSLECIATGLGTSMSSLIEEAEQQEAQTDVRSTEAVLH